MKAANDMAPGSDYSKVDKNLVVLYWLMESKKWLANGIEKVVENKILLEYYAFAPCCYLVYMRL